MDEFVVAGLKVFVFFLGGSQIHLLSYITGHVVLPSFFYFFFSSRPSTLDSLIPRKFTLLREIE